MEFKVTVEYICPNMIDAESLVNEFNNDPMKAYKFISDNFGDSPYNFSESEQVTKVVLTKKQK